jgi:hypothetical protein
MEMLLERRAGRRWAWSASYVLSLAEDEIQDEWVPRRYDQRHAIALQTAFQPDRKWNWALSWRYHSGWPSTAHQYHALELEDGSVFWTRSYGPIRAERLPAYHRLDLRMTREFQVGGNVLFGYLDLFNLYDRTNLMSYEYGGWYNQGQMHMTRRDGEEMLPFIPLIGFRYEF